MEPVSEFQPERRVGPTVSKEKWVSHAKNKLARGYVLIVGTTRRNANFYLRGKGYEMCPYDIACLMIKQGLVVQTGTHHLGVIYELAPEVKAELQQGQRQRPHVVEEPDETDELGAILEAPEDVAAEVDEEIEEELEEEAEDLEEALDEDLDEENFEDDFEDDEEKD
ncbi:hypothetical protein [Rhodothermus bifroesti]|uniref:Uncharacterized protein n=1 Tax=Rhodothermus marinus TaxID=29549 RepID=A0A7V2AYJ6_RHOMR|nr:hypothetical protein [Rhodothermus bifroesti]